MVVDAAIRYWVTLVAGEETGPEGFGRVVQRLAAFFYNKDGLLASPRPARLQAALYILLRIFDRVGMNTNVNKMAGIVCQPYHMAGGHLEAAYKTWMMGGGSVIQGMAT